MHSTTTTSNQNPTGFDAAILQIFFHSKNAKPSGGMTSSSNSSSDCDGSSSSDSSISSAKTKKRRKPTKRPNFVPQKAKATTVSQIDFSLPDGNIAYYVLTSNQCKAYGGW